MDDLKLAMDSIPIERDYFGSEHGKGEGDGEVGCVNKATEKARLGRQVIINSASDWYQFCLKDLASDKANSKRSFILVGTDDIVRHRPATEVCTVTGSRKMHQVVRVDDRNIKMQALSCFCEGCLEGKMCLNVSYVTPYKETRLSTSLQDAPPQKLNMRMYQPHLQIGLYFSQMLTTFC